MTTHTYNAADELDRRAQNRKLAKMNLPKAPAPATPEGVRLMNLTGAELRAEAGVVSTPTRTRTVSARKAQEAAAVAQVHAHPALNPAPKVRTKAQVAATEARKQAWAWRLAERKAGRKVSYADACAKFGTTPAKAR